MLALRDVCSQESCALLPQARFTPYLKEKNTWDNIRYLGSPLTYFWLLGVLIKIFHHNFNYKTQTLWREAQTYKNVVEGIQRVFYAPSLFSFEFADCNLIPFMDLLPPEKQKRKKENKHSFICMLCFFFRIMGLNRKVLNS